MSADVAKKLARLRKAHRDLREDFDALLRVLEKKGATSRAAVSRERLKCEEARVCHAPGDRSPSLVDVMATSELELLKRVHEVGGSQTLKELKQVSPRCREQIQAVQAEKLYVFSGADAHFEKALDAAETFDPREAEWKPISSMRLRRVGSVAGALGGCLYVCGGHPPAGAVVDRYNPKTQKWEYKVPQMNRQRQYAAAVVLGGRLYVCGGEDSSHDVVHASIEHFDPKFAEGKGSWVLDSLEMSVPRRNFAAAVLPLTGEKQLMVCGGRSTLVSRNNTPLSGAVHATAEALYPAGKASHRKPLPLMRAPRVGHGAASLGSSIYICGGHNGDGVATVSVERFDANLGSWFAVAPMILARGNCSVVAMAGSLFVLGGLVGHPGVAALRSVESFDPSRGAWELMHEMLQHRQCGAAAVVKVGALAT